MPRPRIPLLSSVISALVGCTAEPTPAASPPEGLTLTERAALDGARESDTVQWSADGARVGLAGPETAGVWELASGARQGGVTFPAGASVERVVFSPDLRRAYAFGRDSVSAWDLTSGAAIFEVRPPADGPRALEGAALSPDGRTLATGSLTRPSATRQVPHLILWDAATGAQTRALTIPDEIRSFSALAFSPDSALLAVNSGAARVWDLASGALLGTHAAAAGLVGVTWAPDSAHLATATGAGAVDLWDPRTGETRHSLRWDWGVATPARLVYSPDGAQLAAAIQLSTIERVQIWDTRTGRSPIGYLPQQGVVATAPSFNRDGSLLAVTYPPGLNAPMAQILWDTRSGQAAWHGTGERPFALHPHQDLLLRETGGKVAVIEVQRAAR